MGSKSCMNALLRYSWRVLLVGLVIIMLGGLVTLVRKPNPPTCVVRNGKIEIKARAGSTVAVYTVTSNGFEKSRSESTVPLLGGPVRFTSSIKTNLDEYYRWEVTNHAEFFQLDYGKPQLIRTVTRFGQITNVPPIEEFKTYVNVSR